ncbi:MAG: transposase family protein [Pirellulaceae bacterium]
MVTDGVISFTEHFQQVEDRRVVPRTTHSLHSIQFIAVAATIAGTDGPEEAVLHQDT